MSTDANLLVMPKLGLTMSEGMVSKWEVAEGQHFDAGQLLVIIESDKTAFDVEAPAAGVLGKILVDESDTVPVGTLLAHWQLDGQAAASADGGAEVGSSAEEALASAPTPPTKTGADTEDATAQVATPPGSRRVATPLARRLARTGSLELDSVVGTGPKGRIQAADVDAALARAPDAQPPAAALTSSAAPAAVPAPSPRGHVTRPSLIEKTMASRVTQAKRDIPHFYLAVDIDIGPAMTMRADLNRDEGRPRVSLTHLMVAAVVRALQAVPRMNSVWTDDGVATYEDIGVGLAVDTERGLMSPVVRNLQRDDLYTLVAKVDDVVARARRGVLRAEDQQGACVTLSNAGAHHVRYMTSIIIPGQSAILGIGAISPCFRPDPAGRPMLRQELGAVLSSDHRVHTGVGALGFLSAFERALTEPVNLVVQPN